MLAASVSVFSASVRGKNLGVSDATAFSPTEAAPKEQDSPPGVDHAAKRLRFDIAGGFALGWAHSSRVDTGALVPTLVVNLGVQFGDKAAVYAHVEGGSLLFMNQGGAYLVGEWTPDRQVSLGTGLGYESMNNESCCGSDSVRNEWSALSVPLLINFKLGAPPPEKARRADLRLGLEAAAGLEPSTGTLGGHWGIAFGGTWM